MSGKYIKETMLGKVTLEVRRNLSFYINDLYFDGVCVWLWDTLKERFADYKGDTIAGSDRRIKEAQAAMSVTNNYKEKL